MAFEFKKNLIKVQGGRQYLPVSARIVWFREQHPDWAIVTEPLEINHEKQYAIFRATVFNAEGKIMATGTKKEDVKGFGDYLEKAETGAVGRALALCGFGTQFSPELDEVGGGRLADSPQPMGGRYNSGGDYQQSNRYGGNDRYGASDGGRFSPPRERNDAPRNDAPVPRPEPPARPAPPPVAAPEPAEDDFEDLVGSNSVHGAPEDDPFGGNTPNAPTSSPAPKAEARLDAPPACVGCGKALTKAQQDLSTRRYGEALCPNCQRDGSRSERAAAAQR